jgi:glutamate dehydrogenase
MSIETTAVPGGTSVPLPDEAAVDALSDSNPVFVRFDVTSDAATHLRVAVLNRPATLSTLVPLVERLGLEVLDERSITLCRADGAKLWWHDLGVRHPHVSQLASAAARAEAEHVLEALWRGEIEPDGFNRLVIAAGLRRRQVEVLRSYARYLRQVGTTYSQGYLEETLLRHASITRQLAELFAVRFDPFITAERERRSAELEADIAEALDAVASLDEDRILRAFLALVTATVRTNAYRPTDDGRVGAGALSFKFDPSRVPDLPQPRPTAEIWVCSSRVEGVHLRGGRVARGGLRWSDRKEDFRTEVLGLMKAQMVKNAVIVPTGAKGGFVVRRYDSLAADPEAQRAEVVAAYRTFVGALLDLTDNVDGDHVVPPPDVVRHDGDDPYLVVAADKGTATFSDIANDIAVSYGFWLGDAFASGGRTGYDHKVLGITAQGVQQADQFGTVDAHVAINASRQRGAVANSETQPYCSVSS